jgi:uncharacterized protein YceK
VAEPLQVWSYGRSSKHFGISKKSIFHLPKIHPYSIILDCFLLPFGTAGWS